MPEQARFIRGMVAWIGFRQVPFVYDRQERHAGETKYPLGKMIRFALDAITGFSSAPLKLASHVGLALSIGSVLLILYITYAWLSGESIQGWTSLMLVVVVLGAVQMFVLALMGEYIGRLYNQALTGAKPRGSAISPTPPRRATSQAARASGRRDDARPQRFFPIRY
jgi:dolichol-phosphate mannosyltransferase